MSLYMHKKMSFTPPSIYNVNMEDDNDYLLDPEQMHDILPQPYRMINKILTLLLDTVWEIVEGKEHALLAKAYDTQLPRLDEPQELELFSDATALQASTDGKYIFVGLPRGIAAMDALTQAHLSSWEEERVEISSIKSYLFGQDYHFLATLDDMTIARLFLFAHDTFFLIKIVNENSPEHTSKILCQKCEASFDVNYIGLIFEKTSPDDVWLEVHKLPSDSWVKELDTVGEVLLKEKERAKSLIEEDEQIVNVKSVTREFKTSLTVVETLGIQFTKPTPFLKVKPPLQLPLPANLNSSLATAISKVDIGDVLGTGTQHVLGVSHLESRDAMFHYRHEAMLKYLPQENEDVSSSGTFHFVNASCMTSTGLDQSSNTLVAVIVWWQGSPHLYQYSLLRTGKDADFKPELVWPFSSNISSSAVSSCTTHLAVGLENGNIVLWNRLLGLPKGVQFASSASPVKNVRFLDPCLFPLDPSGYLPYPTFSAAFLLAEYSDGTQILFDTCDGSQQIPRCIAEVPENDDKTQILLQAIPEVPELILYIQKNGNMYIKDISTCATVCQITVPPSHQIQTPWDPIFAFGDAGKILYVKGETTEIGKSDTAENPMCIFMYHLVSYPALKTYWAQSYQKRDLAVYTTQEQRISAILKDRWTQQILRKSRLEKRWGQLRSELDLIQQARQVPVESLKILF